MKGLDLYIQCNTLKQCENIFKVCEKNGIKGEYKERGLNVRIQNNNVFIIDWEKDGFCTEISYAEFMQKYGSNTMIEKINQAKKQLNFNNKQLSEALGYSRQYITKMLNLPQSEKIQDKIVKEIDALLNSDKFKKTLASDSIQTRVEDIENPINEISALRFQNNCKDKDITALKKKLENNQVVINKLDDQLIRAEKVHNEDVKALNEANSIIHIKNQRIEELEESAKSKDEDNTKLLNGLVMWKDDCNYAKDRIICERWLFIPLTLILLVMFIFK